MKYISTVTWRDNTDWHLYREGEPFPFDGRDVPPERLSELETGCNRAGLQLIRAKDAQDGETPVTKEEAPEGTFKAGKTALPEKKPEKAAKPTRKRK